MSDLNVRPIPRIVVAGVSSGVGKTTVVAALACAFRARSLEVACYKAGPDYLDPGYHRIASGRRSHNLDGWMMGHDAVQSTFTRTSKGADIAIVEGVMGLFDGASPTSDVGSTAEIARWLGSAVVLVADAGGIARSIAALFAGFRDYDAGLNVAGVICNRVGSRGHLDLLDRALGRDRAGNSSVLGGFPKKLDVVFPERHLGLRTADEDLFPEASRTRLAELAEEWLDLDRLLELAQGGAQAFEDQDPPAKTKPIPVRIGVARDEAFHFYYAENMRLLEEAGAELVEFSPIHDAALPEVDGLIFGGGYPEVHAAALSGNTHMQKQIANFAASGHPVYAECGGLMYLSQGIRDLDGADHDMVGLIEGRAHMQPKLVVLGYVEVELQDNGIFGPAGVRFRGHQFRYSELIGAEPGKYRMRKRRGGDAFLEGYGQGNLLASYVHAHWASNPEMPRAFVAACAKVSR